MAASVCTMAEWLWCVALVMSVGSLENNLFRGSKNRVVDGADGTAEGTSLWRESRERETCAVKLDWLCVRPDQACRWCWKVYILYLGHKEVTKGFFKEKKKDASSKLAPWLWTDRGESGGREALERTGKECRGRDMWREGGCEELLLSQVCFTE